MIRVGPMPDLSSGTLFYRAIDVVPVLTPELENDIAQRMDEARVAMLEALLADPDGRRAFLDPLSALAAGLPSDQEVLDRGYWGVRNGLLPEDRRDSLAGAVRVMEDEGLSVETVMALHPNWDFVERTGAALLESPLQTAAAPGGRAAERFEAARVDQAKVLEKLVEANIRLVVKWARRYGKLTPVDEMDLVQEGCEGLISAARRFDFHRGFRFSTYAVWWIKQAILKSLMRNSRLIRIPAHATIMQSEVNRVRHVYLERLGRYPTEEELVEEVGVTLEMLRALHWSSMETLSLDKALGEDGDSTVHDLISRAPQGPGVVSEAVRRDLRERVEKALGTLDEREKAIVIRKFGLDGSEPVTLAQIGRDLGLSRERVRQLEARAFGKLRKIGILFPEDCE